VVSSTTLLSWTSGQTVSNLIYAPQSFNQILLSWFGGNGATIDVSVDVVGYYGNA
jgi:hypothetical protein